MIEVFPGLVIPADEVRFTASRSSGPGGQNVNKVSSRVTLLFDVDASTVLSAEVKELIRRRLGRRVSSSGVLRVVSQRHRTQAANRQAAQARFVELIRDALAETPVRIATRPSRASRRLRLDEKQRRGRLKRTRGRVRDLDG